MATLRYPKSVFIIVTNEICERFTFFGLRAVLVLYLNYELLYSKNDATAIFHVFNVLTHFFPVLGAIVADSWLGKFKTILYLSTIYAIGSMVLSITAIDELPVPKAELTMVGLGLIAIGTGGIKPCVSAFGGDQFKLPQQYVDLQKFFSFFYFTITASSLISTFVTPILRENVHCFGQPSCFSLAFGVPAALMFISIVAFVVGSQGYTVQEPEGNVVVEVFKCIWHAAVTEYYTIGRREHWLDKADNRFEREFIEDIKCALKVLVLYTPVPLFWALFDLQGSRWTFQAARMSGDLGYDLYIKPDQVQILNPVLILILIPVFEYFVYPVFAKSGLLKRPLEKMIFGGILAGLAFVISAGVEFKLEKTYPVFPVAGSGQLRLYNAAGCDLEVEMDIAQKTTVLKNMDMEMWSVPVFNGQLTRDLNVTWKCKDAAALKNSQITVFNEQATSYTFTQGDSSYQSRNENLGKSDNGDPMVMTIISTSKENGPVHVTIVDSFQSGEYSTFLNSSAPAEPFKKIPRGDWYIVSLDGAAAEGSFEFQQGGSYVVIAVRNGSRITARSHQVTEPNSVNVMWLVPQYVVLTAGEIMFSIPGMEFSFTQAPSSMKSLLTSAWLLTVAFGNLIVIIVAEAKICDSQVYEYLLFAGLMFLDLLLFTYLARRYKYVEPKEDGDSGQSGDIPLQDTSALAQ